MARSQARPASGDRMSAMQDLTRIWTNVAITRVPDPCWDDGGRSAPWSHHGSQRARGASAGSRSRSRLPRAFAAIVKDGGRGVLGLARSFWPTPGKMLVDCLALSSSRLRPSITHRIRRAADPRRSYGYRRVEPAWPSWINGIVLCGVVVWVITSMAVSALSSSRWPTIDHHADAGRSPSPGHLALNVDPSCVRGPEARGGSGTASTCAAAMLHVLRRHISARVAVIRLEPPARSC